MSDSPARGWDKPGLLSAISSCSLRCHITSNPALMPSEEERKAAQAARQARLLAKGQDRLAKITGAAKGEGRVLSDCEHSQRLILQPVS